MKKFGTLFILLLVIATSCEEKNKKVYKPASLGAINNLVVVMETHLWESEIGDKVREHFAAPIVGLTWDEAKFTINHMPQRVFSGQTRHRRSVLFVGLDTVNIAHIKTDLYASPQKVAVIKGTTREEIIQNIEDTSDQIIAAIRQMEIKEEQKRFERSLNKEKVLEDKFNITLKMPSLYTVGKQEDNFVWIDMEIPKGNMNIIAYEMPSESFSDESTFVGDIVKMRDSIGKKYIPGPDIPNKTTYMATEKAFAPYIFSAEIGGKKAVEVRGIWEVQNYPMAGPFLTYIINDSENDRKLVLEGFTFAPATNKRDYMFQLEAILKTVQFN
ncbi:DUF4837 family protein [Muriicola sp. Z0-33]|uniref:DUF4837 family protein n=1 Tax=Muriicola sp. Z0-33 TaxID=2816957 RepID=UPI0022382C0A|nr:DUF4837 family protein [Muriicola sp. Z0-33]MCW5514663.1 DUF4837 family protein [Muriicola sp. Z0-33]